MAQVVNTLVTAAAVFIGGPIGTAIFVTQQVYGAYDGRRKARNAERAQRDAYNASLTDRTVSGVVTAEQPLQVIYGEAIVAPAYVALLTSGDRDQYKHLAAVWAAHECDAIVDVYINGESIGSLDSNGWVTSGRWVSSETSTEAETTTVSSGAFTVSNTVAAFHSATYPDTPGDVSGREYLQADQVTVSGSTITIIDSAVAAVWNGRTVKVNYDRATGGARVRVRHHLGAPGQVADSAWVAELGSDWSSTDKGEGLCYSAVSYDLNEAELQGGPPKLTAKIRGRKVYDPRLDSTQPGGSGAHRADTPSTWAWSRNNALCTADFVRAEWGKGALAAQVNWASVVAAANACDSGVDYGAGTVPLYTCNGAFTTDQGSDQVLDQLCQSMAGFATYNGVWQLQAGVYTAPVMALTDADNDGPFELTAAPAVDEVLNGLRGQFYDPSKYGERTEYPLYSNAAFVSADGGSYVDDLNLPFTDSATRCHQLARVQVERSRGMGIVYPAKMRAVRLQPGQRVTLQNAPLLPTPATFRVVRREWAAGQPVMLTLQQDDPSFYDLADAPAPLSSPTATAVNPFLVAKPNALQASTGGSALVVDPDGTVVQRVTLTFDASDDVLVRRQGRLQIEYRLDTDAAWQSAPDAPGDSSSYGLTLLRENRMYIIRARWVNALNAPSDWATVRALTDAVVRPTLIEATHPALVNYNNIA